MEVSVLVPWSPVTVESGPEREASWAWNRRRLECLLPGVEVVTGSPDVVGNPGVFSRGLALNRAAAEALGDVLLICDADTTYSPGSFREALLVAEEGGWSLPARYVRLSERASAEWLRRDPQAPAPADWESDLEQEYPAPNSGVVAIPRAALEAVGGFCERFRGWGGEDDAMACALTTLWGPSTRRGIAYHLWHPRPPEHSTAAPYTPAQFVLADRFGAATGDPDAMRALIAERG